MTVWSPDPLDEPVRHAADLDEAWEQGYAAAVDGRRWRVAALLLAAICGAVIGAFLAYAVVNAAPRSARLPSIPVADVGRFGAPRSGMPVEARAEASREAAAPAVGVGAPLITEPAAVEGGLASWYRDPSQPADGLYAAVPGWQFGDRPYRVRVCGQHSRACVVVTVRDFCGCPGDRIIDLSPTAFSRLAPLSVGLIPVMVEDAGPGVTPPPTDTKP